ncbi:YlxR family protein [Egicoccus sp. AB-alg6-2]|uniref:YlxR family protein n=1 Tax=Egicoccus sp. AB-alg6-2 TaxID=3242692 RepID=UPI00359CE6B2
MPRATPHRQTPKRPAPSSRARARCRLRRIRDPGRHAAVARTSDRARRTNQEPVKEVPLVREAPRHPVRTCVACRAARPQPQLLRLARTPDGIRFDTSGRLPGRGAYLCPEPPCLDAAARRGATGLRRALRGGTEAEALAALAAIRARSNAPDRGPDEDVQHQVPDGTVRSDNA